jgi:hypothetical protein
MSGNEGLDEQPYGHQDAIAAKTRWNMRHERKHQLNFEDTTHN